MLTVQTRLLSFLRTPHLVAHWVVNHADDDLTFQSKRDRNAKMRDPVKIIHGAVERIDHPLMLARLIAHNSFFAVKRVLRKLFQQCFGDELLCLDVNRQFDVVRLGNGDVLGAMKIFAKHFARAARSFFGCVEIMLHDERLFRTKVTSCTTETKPPSNVMSSEVETSLNISGFRNSKRFLHFGRNDRPRTKKPGGK